MTKIKSLAIFFYCCVSLACTQTQVSEATKSTREAAFKDKYPNAKSVKWGVDDHGNHEANFKQNDEKYRADFTPAGEWIETENSIKFKHLPQAVQDAIKQRYDKDDIVEIEAVNHFQKGIFYDVEIDEKGAKKMDIEYNALGKIIGTE